MGDSPVPQFRHGAAVRNQREAFEDFYFDVCTLDYAKMGKAMEHLVEYMSRTDRVRLVGPGTDLTFSIREFLPSPAPVMPISPTERCTRHGEGVGKWRDHLQYAVLL